jgi:hypothetical protein
MAANRARASLRWWTDKAGAHRSVENAIRESEKHDSARRTEDQHHLRLYSDREWKLAQATDLRSQLVGNFQARKRQRLSLNVVKNAIDGWVNLICQSRPHITFLTKGADWGLQKKARLRTRFVEAHFHANNAYSLGTRIAKNAAIFGVGFIHVIKAHGRIEYDLCLPGEVRVDPYESLAGDPRSIYRVRTIDRYVAAARWPKHAQQIINAPVSGGGNSDRLPFIDAWHLASGPDATDGIHAQIIPGVCTVGFDEYKWDEFPIIPFRFDDAPLGWYGQGVAEELSGIQYEINVILRTIQANMWSGGNLKVAVMAGSNVQPSMLSNQLGCPVIEYTGTAPTFFAHDVASPQLFSHLQYLEQKAYDTTGISQMSAQSMTPFASMSGRARIVAATEYSKRFVTCQQRYEDLFQSLAERTLEAAADLAEDGEDLEVVFPGRDYLEQIRYSDIAGEKNDFDCEAWSASLAGETPAARLAQIEQMLTMGMIDLAGAMYLYEVPHDLRAYMEETLAPIELAREAIDRIIEDGEPTTPTPMMDLARAMKSAQLWYQRGVLRGVDPERLNMLLDFQKMASHMLQMAAGPANNNAAQAGPVPVPSPPPDGSGGPPALAGQTLTTAPVQAAIGM